MARSSKGFNELRQLAQRQQAEAQGLEHLQEKINQSPLKDKSPKIIKNPKGQIKMSSVLEKFVQPYLDTAKTYDQRQMLFELAVMAWNLAIMPELDRQQAKQDLFQGSIIRNQPVLPQEGQEIIEELIERKLTHFANIQRFIVDFDLQDDGDRINLSVASTSPPSP